MANKSTSSTLLWTPDKARVETGVLAEFVRSAIPQAGAEIGDYSALHRYSVTNLEVFWNAVWDFCGVIGEKGVAPHLADADKMPGATFFPDAELNYAENMLKKTGGEAAIIFRAEDKMKRSLSWDELHAHVSRLQQAMKDAGVGPGDRVAGMMPNMPETVIATLAASSLGAIWSSCSPDFGEGGVLDRFGQIRPKVFFACDGYWYNGKEIDVAKKLKPIVEKLESAETVVVVPFLTDGKDLAASLPRAATYEDFLAPYEAKTVTFKRMPFNHPLFILYSSGTTGVPKCIVHGAGGTLLQHLKEHRLHCGLNEGDRAFYFTTCGWMMWNWLITFLASGCTICLYDGSPFAPDGNVLFDYAQDERFALFGTSAKYIDAVKKAGLRPADTHDLSSVRLLTSTGSPLAPESFDFVYEGMRPDVHLASISGGTDIVSCFVLGNPWEPVHRGEIQNAGLGMAVQVWNDAGTAVREEKGELVCAKPFPSMPVKFWNDESGEKYRSAYFSRFENVWCHGDFAEWTANGGLIIHGRSDATLNPGGVRIGTAEIYAQAEKVPEVLEAICIGQNWDNDVRVILFVRLMEGVTFDEELAKRIKTQIRTGASPRHVPAVILEVPDIPRTKSGKITELAVRDMVEGRTVKNKEALANPEALDHFANRPELRA